MNQKLSEFFTLDEMTRTSVLVKLPNKPSDAAYQNLRELCLNYLDPLRRRFGKILINSGYRNAELNKAVGGAKNSYHLKGLAADIRIGNYELGLRMAAYLLTLDDGTRGYGVAEIILNKERGYLHIAIRPKSESNQLISVRL